MSDKSIKLFYSPITGEVYASSEYSEVDGEIVEITGRKCNVTEDFTRIMLAKMREHYEQVAKEAGLL